MRRKPVTAPQQKAMRALREQGVTLVQIGARFGFHATTVRYHVLDVKVSRQPAAARQANVKRARKLARLDRFFASCNRAIAEART